LFNITKIQAASAKTAGQSGGFHFYGHYVEIHNTGELPIS
jgi:hypothetical protein